MDVLSTSVNDNKLAWYENYGNKTFSTQKIISTQSQGPQYVHAADVDGDGDMDVLCGASGSNGYLAWYQNTDGQGTFSSVKAIASQVSDGISRDLYPVDFDADGDLDLVAAIVGQGFGGVLSYSSVSWFENTDGQGTFSDEKVISTEVNDPRSVYAADFNNDGKVDVVSASRIDDKVAWYENTMPTTYSYDSRCSSTEDCQLQCARDTSCEGYTKYLAPVSFGDQTTISTQADHAHSVHAADIDGDGDMDVLSASANDNKIAWYENTDGQGTFSSQKTITTQANWAHSVYAADIDGDGDMDVLSASADDDKIAWYENTNGQGVDLVLKRQLLHKPIIHFLFTQLTLMAMVIWMSLVHHMRTIK